MAGTPASGAAVLFGLRPELAYGVPDTSKSRVWYEPDLPLALDLQRPLGAPLEADSRGFAVRGIAAPITGPVDFAIPLRAATSLEMIEHVLGGRGVLAKSTLETNVYQYLATPTRVNGDTSFDAIVCLAPVDRQRPSGIKWQSVTIPIGPGEIPARMAGFFSQSTHLSAFTKASGSGTYTKGPDLRGLVRRPRVGEKFYIKATRTVAGGGLQYKAERVPSGGTPTYPGAAIDAYYDSAGAGDWQNLVVALQLTGTVTVATGGTAVTGISTDLLNEVAPHLADGVYIFIAGENIRVASVAAGSGSGALTLAAAHTAGATGVVAHILNQDAGFWDETRDTCDIIWPGTTTDHADIVAAGTPDVYTFEETWANPTPSYIASQRFTSAHWSVYWRRQGASTWIKLDPEGNGQLVISWPLTVSQGWGTLHPTGATRDGLLGPTFQFARKYADRDLLRISESREPFELYAIAEGRKLGTGAYRESIRIDAKAAEFTTRAAPVSGAAAVVETLTATFKASAAGDPPLTTTTITDRNYTVVPA